MIWPWVLLVSGVVTVLAVVGLVLAAAVDDRGSKDGQLYVPGWVAAVLAIVIVLGAFTTGGALVMVVAGVVLGW